MYDTAHDGLLVELDVDAYILDAFSDRRCLKLGVAFFINVDDFVGGWKDFAEVGEPEGDFVGHCLHRETEVEGGAG